MTDEYKKIILFEHNKFRNLIAGGKLPKKALPTALYMRTFEWNVDLEYLASLNCKACEFEHDDKSM